MKKLAAILAAFVIVLTAASCGVKAPEKSEEPEPTAVIESTPEPEISVEPEPEAEPSEEPEPTADEEEASKEPEEKEQKSGIRDDFKEAMDSYEEFMDEYVDFMNKYSKNPSDLTLLGQYADYMTKYTKMVEKFDKWESEDMTTQEAAYYLEVQTRVSKKLLEVAK